MAQVFLGMSGGVDSSAAAVLLQEQGYAVSGLHLSLVSMAAYGLLRKAGAGYGRAAVAGGLVLMVYSILTGASPSILRALIMTLCGFLAAYLGRTYDLFIGHGSVGADTFVVQSLSGGSGRGTAVVCSHRRNRTGERTGSVERHRN